MSDKSKLGFNINPKNYDELNSTDNLITSGSDSGWLGNKLQGGDSNDLDLSKINPIFDKELYEKYRPGVNTNDGSVNQDIWGFKCFNNPVSFRNGIYGDTYSITENKSSGDIINLIPETYATIKSDTTVKNKIYNRTDNDTNNYSEYTYKKYNGPVDYDNSQFTYMDTVIPDSDDHTISDITIKSHSESHCDNNAFAINDEYERTLCSVRPNYYIASAHDVSDAQYVYSVNYANTQYERKLQAYTPAVSTDSYFLTDEKNVTATFSMHANSPYILNYGDEPETGANILLETNCARTVDGIVSDRYAACNIASPDYYNSSVKLLAKEDSNECNIEVTTNYIQIGAADGDFSATNDKFSHIFVLNNRINKSISGKAIDIDYHVKDIVVDYLSTKQNITGPAIDITFDYRKTAINGQVDSSIETYCLEAAYPAKFQNLNGVASINVAGIYAIEDENNLPTYKKYCGTYITPTSITTNGIQFDMLDFDDIRDPHSTVHNKLVPVARKFNNIDTAGLQLFACATDTPTSFICDYLEVSKSIKCSNILGSGLAYVNPTNNAETELLTVSNENLILPRGNKTIQLGSNDNRFDTIYGDLNGTAVIADHAGTAEQATKDQDGNIIKSSYLNILNFGRNDIESYNAIIGEGERLFFFDEKYFDTNNTIPPIHKSYSSIGTSGTYETECYNLYISKTLSDEDITRTKKCCVSYELRFDSETAFADFYMHPKTLTSDTFESVDSMNIGAPEAPWDELYCNKFPTIAGTTGGTFVGNIRLLCIKGPATLTTIEHEIQHGSIIKNPMQIGGKQFTIHIANLRVYENSKNLIGVTGEVDTVEGEWQLLSSALVVANSANIAVFTPVLAMRVK